MALIVYGLNHKTAPAAVREKVAFPKAQLADALHELIGEGKPVSEAVILSTCNRTEIYANGVTAPLGKAALVDFIVANRGLDQEEQQQLERSSYFRQSKGCVKHLMRVVSSLDSLVLGEAQILGQVRQAFQDAQEANACGKVMTHLFRQALEAGKRVRNETAIGAQSVSVSTVAVGLALRTFPRMEDRHVLVIGAGEMAELLLMYLAEKGAHCVTVANRTLEKAQALASRYDGRAISLEELPEALATCDICISSTGAQGYVLTPELVKQARAKSADSALLCIDIALPRDIDPACSQIDGVSCYNLDDLGSIIDEHKLEREREADRAEALADEETNRFLLWMQESTIEGTLKEVYGKAGNICQREVAHAMREMAKVNGVAVTDEQRAVLEALANAVSKKILHGPMTRIRKQATNPDAYLYTDTARFLFGLDSNPSGLPCGNNPHKCHLDRGATCGFAESGTCPFGRSIQ